MDDFPKFNQIYAEYFGEKFQIRSCVEFACLPKNAIAEIEAIAFY